MDDLTIMSSIHYIHVVSWSCPSSQVIFLVSCGQGHGSLVSCVFRVCYLLCQKVHCLFLCALCSPVSYLDPVPLFPRPASRQCFTPPAYFNRPSYYHPIKCPCVCCFVLMCYPLYYCPDHCPWVKLYPPQFLILSFNVVLCFVLVFSPLVGFCLYIKFFRS